MNSSTSLALNAKTIKITKTKIGDVSLSPPQVRTQKELEDLQKVKSNPIP